MEQKIIYVCDDGSRFDDKKSAKKYSELCDNIKKVEKLLNERTSKCEEGVEYVRQSEENVEKYRRQICNLAA